MFLRTKYIIAFILSLVVLFFVFNIYIKQNRVTPTLNEYIDSDGDGTGSYEAVEFTFEIIPAPNNTYGYSIIMGGRTLIHQPNAPALPGVEGFKTREDAQKVAEFVIEKIRRHDFPPSVSVRELDSLGVFHN